MKNDPTRANRRERTCLFKERMRKHIKSTWPDWEDTKENLGKMAAVHGADCSCFMCGNPRKHWKEKTLQEKKADLDEKEIE